MSSWNDPSQTAAATNTLYSPQVRNDPYARFSSSDIFAASSSFKDDIHRAETTSAFDCKNLHVSEEDPSSRFSATEVGAEEYRRSSFPLDLERPKSAGPKWRSKRVEELKRQTYPSWDYPKHTANGHNSYSKTKRPEEWWYTDPTGACQGPFHSSKMQEWYIQGFFKSHLPIRCNENTPFIPLGQWFGSKNPAFLDAVPPNWKEETQHADKQIVHAMEEKLEDKPSTDEGELDAPKHSDILEKYSTSQASDHQPIAAPQIETSPHTLFTSTQTMLPAPVAELPKKLKEEPLHSMTSDDWWVNPTTSTFSSDESWQRKLHHSTKPPESSLQNNAIISSPAILESQPSPLGGSRLGQASSRLQHPAPLAYSAQHTPINAEFRSALKSLGYDSVSKAPAQDTPSPTIQTPAIQLQPPPPPIPSTHGQQFGIEKKLVPNPQVVQPPAHRDVRQKVHVPIPESTVVQNAPRPVAHPRKTAPSSWTQTGHQKANLIADELRVAKQRGQIGSQRQNQSLSWSQRMKPVRDKAAVVARAAAQPQRTVHQAKMYENPKTRNPSAAMSWGGASSAGGRMQNARQVQKPKPKSKAEGGKKKSRGGNPPATNLENPFGDDWQKMSTEFHIWSKEELRKLSKGKAKNNFTDCTDLIKFLMSLSSEEETREMILQYLGNTPKVQNFADGFLLRKCFTMDEYAQSKGEHDNVVQKANSRSKRKKKRRQE